MMDDASSIMNPTPRDGPKGHHQSPYTSLKMGNSLRFALLIICSSGKKHHNRTLTGKGEEEGKRGTTTTPQRPKTSDASDGVTGGKGHQNSPSPRPSIQSMPGWSSSSSRLSPGPLMQRSSLQASVCRSSIGTSQRPTPTPISSTTARSCPSTPPVTPSSARFFPQALVLKGPLVQQAFSPVNPELQRP